MAQFRKFEKDVLVATDVASKGLDFPDIKHVINYDMPEDIENYGKFFRDSINQSKTRIECERVLFNQSKTRSECERVLSASLFFSN